MFVVVLVLLLVYHYSDSCGGSNISSSDSVGDGSVGFVGSGYSGGSIDINSNNNSGYNVYSKSNSSKMVCGRCSTHSVYRGTRGFCSL